MSKCLSASRGWCLTQSANKISQEDLEKALANYVWLAKKEKGEEGGEQGYEHYQIYIENPTPIRFSTLKKLLPNAHIEPRKGTKKEALDYILKLETGIGEPFGSDIEIDVTEERGKRTDLLDIIAFLEQGVGLDEIRKMYPSQYFMYENRIKAYLQSILRTKYENEWRDITVNYIHGVRGKGKTSHIVKKYGYKNVFIVSDYEHPFDEYEGQKVILFDDFYSSLKLEKMLRALDGHPYNMPARYGNKIACYTEVYITANISLDLQYPNVQLEIKDREKYLAFLGRIKYIWNMNTQTEPVINPEWQKRQNANNPNYIPLKTHQELMQIEPIEIDGLPF